jgi:hypothetical protein
LHRAASSYHDPNRLIWLYDVHLLISRMSESEWQDFAQIAVRFGIQDICLEPVVKSCKLFAGEMPEMALRALDKRVSTRAGRSRFEKSHLGLMIDDMRQLRGIRSRMELAREYLIPPGEYLLQRYGKTEPYWVPILYFRYLIAGLFERLTLN